MESLSKSEALWYRYITWSIFEW